MRTCRKQGLLCLTLAACLLPIALRAQTRSSEQQGGAPSSAEPASYKHRFEVTSSDNIVSHGFGHWLVTGVQYSFQPSARGMISGQVLSQTRPGETEQLFGVRSLLNWTPWFYTDLSVSGGGPDDPLAYFPRFRYDANLNLKIPQLPGLILTGGLTRLYFGAPNGGRVRRGGAIYYWRRFVFQGLVNFNNVRPGNRKSRSVNGAAQYGQEGRYWVGLTAGGGREAWQTLGFTPQELEFKSYSTSVFLRKWLAPNYGIAIYYGFSEKRTAYHLNGLEARFFFDF